MKILCAKCDEPMALKRSEGFEDKTVGLTFACPKCSGTFVMFINPMEAQLVRSLGVKPGGATGHSPMEAIKGTLAEGDKQAGLTWSEEAESQLEKIPPFVRPMAKAGVERFASEKGYKEITPSVMAEARKLYGM